MTEFASAKDVYERLEKDRLARLAKATKMQCKVCWYIYDPEEGCPENQTPPGTPFLSLPQWWTCPECGQPLTAFLPYEE